MNPYNAGSSRRDPVFGSRSLPKGASASLNYGLMVGRIQQKRQQGGGGGGAMTMPNQHHSPIKKTADGSLSDSNNYSNYGEFAGGRGQVKNVTFF